MSFPRGVVYSQRVLISSPSTRPVAYPAIVPPAWRRALVGVSLRGINSRVASNESTPPLHQRVCFFFFMLHRCFTGLCLLVSAGAWIPGISLPCGIAKESRSHVVGGCEMRKKERDVSEKMMKMDECDMAKSLVQYQGT